MEIGDTYIHKVLITRVRVCDMARYFTSRRLYFHSPLARKNMVPARETSL